MSDKLRIVALADSLALPRDEDGTRVLWDDTWPYLLGEILRKQRETDVEVINCGQRSFTAVDAASPEIFRARVELTRPNVVVLEAGIVDCAPRIFSKREKLVIGLLPEWARRPVIDLRAKRRADAIGRDPLRRVYTRPDQYRRSLEALRERIAKLELVPRVIALPVLSHPRLDLKSPGYSANVARYNAILESTWENFVRPEVVLDGMSNDEFFAGDGYHLAVAGNRRVAQVLAARI